MTLEDDDYLVGVEIVGEDGLMLSIAENGFGKRTPLKEYRLTASRRQGRDQHEDHQPHRQGGRTILSVKEDSELMIISQNGKIIRIESATIRQAGRSTQGVKLVSLETDDKVAAASVIPESGRARRERRPVQDDRCRCSRLKVASLEC